MYNKESIEMKDRNPKLAKNRVADGATVYDPASNAHIKGAARIAPVLNEQARNRNKGVRPGQDSLMSMDEYQNGAYAADIKRDSPDRPLR
jgi:hypothetical protein